MELQVPPGTIFHVTLSAPAEVRYVIELAAARAKEAEEQAALARTYHLGVKPTKERGYDDRLTMRTGYSRSTLLPLLKHGLGRKMEYGVLVGLFAANKWIVSEAAVRAWLGYLK